jgi:hypothetical protein
VDGHAEVHVNSDEESEAEKKKEQGARRREEGKSKDEFVTELQQNEKSQYTAREPV